MEISKIQTVAHQVLTCRGYGQHLQAGGCFAPMARYNPEDRDAVDSTCWHDAGSIDAAGCHKGKGQEESHCNASASHCFIVESAQAPYILSKQRKAPLASSGFEVHMLQLGCFSSRRAGYCCVQGAPQVRMRLRRALKSPALRR